ncbi:MAG: flavodoxin family protein [Candidatus Thorarchaeota archaeon]|jgi:multimeric flavodoxin WrbA
MVRILGIVGSPRTQGNTFVLVEIALNAAKKEGAEIQMIELGDLKIATCAHGGECYELGSCVQEDDLNSIAKAMDEADGIIFGSPAYQAAVPGIMKNMLDRAGRFVNLRGKVGGALVVGRRSGLSFTLNELFFFMYVKEMVVPGTPHWPIGFGLHVADVHGDTEAIMAAEEIGTRVTHLAQRFVSKPLPWMEEPEKGEVRPSFGDDWR